MASSSAITISLRKAASKHVLSNEERELLMRIALEELYKQQYRFVKVIGGGTFGDVVAVTTPDQAKIVAAKVIFDARTSVGELELWLNIKHPNILSVDKIIHKEVFNIFITKYHNRSLQSTLKNGMFCSDQQCFRSLKVWLMDILSGLEYLHSSNLVHLDLKLNNVLLSVEDCAIICDFGHMASLNHQPIRRTGLPFVLRPPETRSNNHPVDGIAYDAWAFGMVALLCFTGQWFSKNARHRNEQANWEESVYPLIFTAVQIKNFMDIFQTEFCSLWTSKRSLSYAHNLLQGVLRFNPKARPQVSEIKRHALFTSDETALFEPDFIWNEDIRFEKECIDHQCTALCPVGKKVQSIIAEAAQKVSRRNLNIDARIHRLSTEMEDARKHRISKEKDDDKTSTEMLRLHRNADMYSPLRAKIQQIIRNAAEEVRNREAWHNFQFKP